MCLVEDCDHDSDTFTLEVIGWRADVDIILQKSCWYQMSEKQVL